MEEETRLAHSRVDEQRRVDARAALSMQTGRTFKFQRGEDKKKLFCDHCKRDGHTIEKCFKLHGYPPGWKREDLSQRESKTVSGIKQITLNLKGSF